LGTEAGIYPVHFQRLCSRLCFIPAFNYRQPGAVGCAAEECTRVQPARQCRACRNRWGFASAYCRIDRMMQDLSKHACDHCLDEIPSMHTQAMHATRQNARDSSRDCCQSTPDSTNQIHSGSVLHLPLVVGSSAWRCLHQVCLSVLRQKLCAGMRIPPGGV
jgi:hypothetical protein